MVAASRSRGTGTRSYNPARYSNRGMRSHILRGGDTLSFFRRYQYPETWPILRTNTPEPQLKQEPSVAQYTAPSSPPPLPPPITTTTVVHTDDKEAPFSIKKSTNEAFFCPTDPPSENQAGCWLFSDGQTLIDRRNVNAEKVPGTRYGEIYINEAGAPGMGGFSKSMTPLYSKYTKDLYSTPVLDSDRRESIGILVNSATGKMYEGFMDDIPPPNTDQSIPRERFEVTNPKLTMLKGGIDPNRKLPQKKELCQNIPDASNGPNVWGDQLYADRRRSELQTRVQRDVWNHRDGNYSTVPVYDRKPVGYVGYVNANRPLPYLPPTQRNTLDNNCYSGNPSFVEGIGNPSVRGVVEPLYTSAIKDEMHAFREAYAQPSFSDNGPYVNPIVSVPVTERSSTCDEIFGPASFETAQRYVGGDVHENVYPSRVPEDVEYMGAGPSREGVGEIVISDTAPRPTLKTQMEDCFPIRSAGNQNTGAYVVTDTSLRATLKTQMEGCFPVTTGSNADTGAYVVTDREVRPTLKTQMEGCFPVTTASNPGTGAYVVTDTDPRPTLKTQMEGCFPVTSAANPGTGAYVVTDTDPRPTLKTEMEGCFPVTSAANPGTGAYVVIDTDPRPTLKTQMEGCFPVTSAANPGTGAYVVTDTDPRPTLKTQMEGCFPVTAAANPGTGAYVVIDTDPRPTLKTQMEGCFPITSAANESTGAYVVTDTDVRPTQKSLMQECFPVNSAFRDNGDQIGFQGEVNPTRRQFYKDKSRSFSTSRNVAVGTMPGFQDIIPETRGVTDEPRTYFQNGSLIPDLVGGTSARVIGYHDTETQREFCNRFPTPDRRVFNEPRVLPSHSTSCRDESVEQWRWLTPTYFGEVQGS